MSRPDIRAGEGASPASAPEARTFEEPWQAKAFAITLVLHEKGLFSWPEWAEALSAEVKRSDAAPDGHDYYRHWLAALEKLLARKHIAASTEVDALAGAWERAAHATPHGKSILLENDPLHRHETFPD